MPLSTSLPPELLLEILTLLHAGRNPLNILLVSSSFYNLFSELLYGHLKFRRIAQLARFVDTFGSTILIPRPIRNITIDVDNGLRLGLYGHIKALFSLCITTPEAEIDEHAHLVLENLNFRFHTHSRSGDLFVIYEALALVNPRSFTWVGPDPPHHFSAAIVPPALSYILRALATHTNLTQLTLSHVKFPDNGEILPLPSFPSLKSLTLSQVIFLRPDIVAEYLLKSGSQLESVKLIDAYQHSIWGLDYVGHILKTLPRSAFARKISATMVYSKPTMRTLRCCRKSGALFCARESLSVSLEETVSLRIVFSFNSGS